MRTPPAAQQQSSPVVRARRGPAMSDLETAPVQSDRSQLECGPEIDADRNPLCGEAVDKLRELLGDGDAANRALAAEALGQVSERALPALAALIALLRDPDDRVRCSAAQAVGEIVARAAALPADISPRRVTAELLHLLARSGSLNAHTPGHAAFRALAKLGIRHPGSVLPQIVCELGSDSHNVQCGIGEALQSIAISHPALVSKYLARARACQHEVLAGLAERLEEKLFSVSGG